jgi:hypothetical protein
MLDIHIRSGGLKQLLILVPPKDRGSGQLKFRFGKPRWNTSVKSKFVKD